MGDRTVTLKMADGNAVRLKIVISGPAVPGGVTMAASSVSLGPASAPARYTGHVVMLAGSVMQAAVSGASQQLSLGHRPDQHRRAPGHRHWSPRSRRARTLQPGQRRRA